MLYGILIQDAITIAPDTTPIDLGVASPVLCDGRSEALETILYKSYN